MWYVCRFLHFLMSLAAYLNGQDIAGIPWFGSIVPLYFFDLHDLLFDNNIRTNANGNEIILLVMQFNPCNSNFVPRS
jgi:hypothetical protein